MSYVRVSILGAAPGGEVWSINPTIDPTGEFPGGVDQSKLDSAAAAIAALSPGAALISMMSTAITITGARLEVRDDVTDALLAISIAVRATPLAGGGTPLRGAQSALVFSLRTDTPGGSGRGRLYWPCIATAVDAQLRIAQATVLTAVDGMGLYLHAMEAALGTAFNPILFDLGVRSKTTKTTPHVNKIQAGNVIDTQRRRRDKMIETYSTAAF